MDFVHVIINHVIAVRETVSLYFDHHIELLRAVDPFDSVAVGAAIDYDKLVKKQIISDRLSQSQKPTIADRSGAIVIADVQPTSIDVLNTYNKFIKFLLRNKQLRLKQTYRFTTVEVNQDFPNIVILQGEDKINDVNLRALTHVEIGNFTLNGINLYLDAKNNNCQN